MEDSEIMRYIFLSASSLIAPSVISSRTRTLEMLTDKMLLGFEPHQQVEVPDTFVCVCISEESCTGVETVQNYLWKGCRRERRERKGRIKEWLNQEGTSRAWLVLPPWSEQVTYSRLLRECPVRCEISPDMETPQSLDNLLHVQALLQ